MAQKRHDEPRFPMPMPYGWYPVAYADELPEKGVMPLEYFDAHMVLYRGEDGIPRVLDAFCEHMGAHLGHGGKVVGNAVACPFHAWEYDDSGACINVPYAKRIPPKAKKPCMKVWPSIERNQMIWVWYHPEDAAPEWEVGTYEEANSGDWTPLERHDFIIKTHPMEMCENAADIAHFKYVHGTAEFPDRGVVTYDGPHREGFVDVMFDTPRGNVPGKIENANRGPGEAWTRFSGLADTFLLSGVTPIDRDTVHLRFAFTQPKENLTDWRAGVSKGFVKEVIRQVKQDIPIWEHKIHLDKLQLCDGDGPIADLRKWYQQFLLEGAR